MTKPISRRHDRCYLAPQSLAQLLWENKFSALNAPRGMQFPSRRASGTANLTIKTLSFADLERRHVGVSIGLAACYSEAVCVCLDRHHISPADFQLKDNSSIDVARAIWITVDQRTKNAWANKDDATRDGAYGLSLAAIEVMRGLVAVARAETLTGADYYLGLSDTSLDDLESTFRLEVSGTDEGTTSIINARLHQKLAQAAKGNSNFPAIACVVGFSALQIVSADVEQS